ncbi:flagellar protein [Bacillus haikouensis]|jgi:flagellar operon protein|uniref:TIGR02530 family flagellar biosynthesis protein n=1 Tax=Bacillus haikouensis TaxID=1510468 RepID=UPI001555DE7E|nr:TIGR02530 family flagellar biosynthesis protein [Bacillus haikouensis]NQD66829.1 flagellar protein [Bacillus haikouensis]
MEKAFLHRVPSQPITANVRPKAIHAVSKPGDSFAAQLNTAIHRSTDMQISKHAKVRMEQRGISISPQVWEKIGEKISEAKSKGVQESLIILNDAALIVSAKNRTVITAMDRQEATSQIFTNINGTILIDS